VLAVVVQVSCVDIANIMTRIRLLMGSDVASGITGMMPTVDIAVVVRTVRTSR